MNPKATLAERPDDQNKMPSNVEKKQMSQLKLKEALTGIEIGNKLRVKQPLSDTGRLYANTTIKSTRNRLLLIGWKPQLSSAKQSARR